MKITGKVVSFDGYSGKIIGLDKKEYLILNHEIYDNIKENDIVMFDADKFKDVELEENVARFITLIGK